MALLTAVVALASAVAGLVFDVWPRLRPDPGTNHSADISVWAVEPHVAVGDWLRRVYPSPQAYAAAQRSYLRRAYPGTPHPTLANIRDALAAQGEMFYVRMRIEGFKRASLQLRWTIYRSTTGAPLEAARGLSDQTGWIVVGEAPSDASVALAWVPSVPVRGMLFARFELRDKSGTILDVADSGRFRGIRSR